MSYYGFIFERGGSKRIKDKNIVDFHGIPLISHVIETCKKCKYIQDIIVSTDSEKIAKIAKQSDAKITFMLAHRLHQNRLEGNKKTHNQNYKKYTNFPKIFCQVFHRFIYTLYTSFYSILKKIFGPVLK